MQFMKNGVRALISLTRLNRGFNSRPAYNLFFIYYMLIKLETLLKMQLKLQCIPDDIFTFLIMKHRKCSELSVDDNLYVLCNPNSFKDSKNNWFYLLYKGTKRKYKIAMIFTNEVPKNTILVSESMKLNVNNRLSPRPSDDTLYFLLSVPDNSANYATEVKISLISNPYDCTEELMTSSLKNFFTNPKYIRLHDIFSINIRKYVPESVYCASNDLKLKTLHFKVSNIKTENDLMNRDGCFVVYGKTTLIQETNINSYIPQKCFCDISFDLEKQFCSSWPPALKKSLEHLQSCIAPFIQKDVYLNLKPVFLVEGPNGSGKSRLIKLSAEMLGLHLLEADFTEVQSLTSAQTEAKLRIIFSDAENCVPCILMLKNIQIFGINSEGQKDERVLSAFSAEIKKLYSKKLKYPIIIMATSNDSEIPIDPEKTFLEKIKMNYLENNQRTEMISWIIKRKGLRHQADLEKIAKICSDFVLVDLDGLVSHAIKIRFKLVKSSQQNFMELQHDDFVHACEYMQSMFSDQIGAPRVPKVYWEDIGGLADLKHEIINRIEILNVKGMNRSGLLLYGPPGTGKTLLAKAVATECRLHFLSVKGPELLNMYVGQSEKNVRQVFERARAAAPCIIFFDELDSLAPNRGRSGDSGGVMDRVVSQLLAEMDGLESSGNIFIIAATNRPDLIDPALLRPGRFDKMLYVGIYNDRDSQLSVLKAVTRKFRLEKDGNELEELVDRLPTNLTGADLHSVCSNAWLGAVRRILTGVGVKKENVVAEDIIVKLEDFIKACKNLVPSVSKEEMARYEKLKNELSSR